VHKSRGQDGFTLIEVLVTMAIFSVVSVGFYQLLFATTRGSRTAESVARVSEEARLGLNRLVRDAREASDVLSPTTTSYRILVDFDGDGNMIGDAVPSDPAGNYEDLTVTWSQGAKTISLSNGVTTEVLMRGVDCVRKTDGTCQAMFTYSSSRLEYDTNGNGVTSATELDLAPSLGNGNGVLDAQELNFVDGITYSFKVEHGDSDEDFYAEAQMRNQR